MEDIVALLKTFAGAVQFIAVVGMAGLIVWAEWKNKRKSPEQPVGTATRAVLVERHEHDSLKTQVATLSDTVENGHTDILCKMDEQFCKVNEKLDDAVQQSTRAEEQVKTLFSRTAEDRQEVARLTELTHAHTTDIRVLHERTRNVNAH